MRRTLSVVGLLAFLGATACPAEQTQQLTLTGSSTVAPLAAEIARQYEAEHPDVRIDVQTGGSSRGIADATHGLADIGMASRALKGEETKLHAYTIARDGVAIILHADNPVSALTSQQIVKIYTGKITNWKQVGGKDREIVVVNKAEGRATLEVFVDYFELDTKTIDADVVIGDNEQGIKTVAGNPDAIAYVSIGTAQFDIDNGVKIKLLGVDGVDATLKNVANGTYPVGRPLNLITKEPASGLAKDFIDYVRSEKAAPIVKHQYFVQVSS